MKIADIDAKTFKEMLRFLQIYTMAETTVAWKRIRHSRGGFTTCCRTRS